jgi:Mlc titration factor MtfA (ptsG expression regulator)
VLAHEFAHKLYGQFIDTDRGKGYADAAEWQTFINPQTKEHFLTTLRYHFVEEDGINGPDEDFSNNIEYFLFDPKKLNAKSPKIYDWIQKKYGSKFKLGKGSK